MTVQVHRVGLELGGVQVGRGEGGLLVLVLVPVRGGGVVGGAVG